jgi:glutathione peroxidase
MYSKVYIINVQFIEAPVMRLNPLLLIPAIFPCSANVTARHIDSPLDLDIEVRRLGEDQKVNLGEAYRGKVLLMVNTASKCGFTSQYEGLEKLYEQYRDDGLVVLGFPSNDFAGQEPGSEKQIQNFCRLTYGVKFPMFEKANVKKANASALYERLGQAAGYPRWNFHKYLIDSRGRLVGSYGSSMLPENGPLFEHVKSLLSTMNPG